MQEVPFVTFNGFLVKVKNAIKAALCKYFSLKEQIQNRCDHALRENGYFIPTSSSESLFFALCNFG